MSRFHFLNVDLFKVYMNINPEKAITEKYFLKDKDGTYWDIQNNPQSKNNLPKKNLILQFQRKFFSQFLFQELYWEWRWPKGWGSFYSFYNEPISQVQIGLLIGQQKKQVLKNSRKVLVKRLSG